ncbi:unnamed protein product [marine sediment metagenome]|uniref:Ribbon-helix-helix protein CopG domain-containing protein n=1 Tax=marine sediment metagenome TaxID=412755 RepID=X0T1K7_9ZZZZ
MNIMPRPGWVAISIPEEMINEIKRLIEQNPHLGYKSTSDYVAEALRRLFSKHSQLVSRFLPVKIQEDHVMIRDSLVGRDVTVRFLDGGVAHCDDCDKAECVHINYALTLPDVTTFLKRKGWKRKT